MTQIETTVTTKERKESLRRTKKFEISVQSLFTPPINNMHFHKKKT